MSFHHSNMWNRYTRQFHISGNRNIHMFDTRQYVVLFYSRRIDVIIQKHNVLPEQEQLRNKYRMWIYVVATILSTIGLSIAIELTREKPETEFVHDKARIEIPKLHISDISK